MTELEDGKGLNTDRERTAAWKYVGYPGFSKFLASSNDCLALRKFADLNVRVLLKVQNDIVSKERGLRKMDLFTMGLPGDRGGCASFRLDVESPRERLLDEIACLLKDYNQRLVHFLQIQDRPVVSREQLCNLQSWLSSYPNAVESPEQEFITYEQDLISVRASRRTHFGRWMETLSAANVTAFRQGSTPNDPTKYYDRNAWKSTGGLWLMLSTMMLLFGPLWAMPFVNRSVVRLAIITALTIAFSILVTIGTTLKPSHRSLVVAGYFTLTLLLLGMTPAWGQRVTGRPEATIVYSLPVSTRTVRKASVPSTVTVTLTPTLTATSSSHIMQPTTSSASSTTVPNRGLATPASHSASLSAGATAGIAVGSAVVILVIAASLFWYGRRQRRSIKDDIQPVSVSPK